MTPDLRPNPVNKRVIWRETGGRCVYCNKENYNSRALEMLIPKGIGGTFIQSNLIPCCGKCRKKRYGKPGWPVSNLVHAEHKDLLLQKEQSLAEMHRQGVLPVDFAKLKE